MVTFIGQENIIKNITNNSFPKVSLFNAPKGYGKHQLIKYIQDNFNFNLIELADKLTAELIEELYLLQQESLVIINLDNYTEKDQNVLLKFLEETPKYCYIILLSSDLTGVLETILNRVYLFKFQDYTDSELQLIVSKYLNIELPKYLINFTRSPGQLITLLQNNQYQEIELLCNKIITQSKRANLGNMLSINNKLNYTEEYNKFDPILFLQVLAKVSSDSYIFNKDLFSNFIYDNTINVLTNYNKDNRLNLFNLIELLLINIWQEAHK